jgi:hypothetical protein
MKGLTLCQSAVIIALFVIGACAVFYWVIMQRFYQMHVIVKENEVERKTINIANVLLSSEELISTPSVSYCAGTPTPCNLLDSAICPKQLGCSWDGSKCVGTPVPCEKRYEENCNYGCSELSFGRENYFRGVFEKVKLDRAAIYLEGPSTEEYTKAVIAAINNAKEWQIGYPNSYVVYTVVDLEKTKNDKFVGWVGAFKGPFSVKATYLTRFFDCLKENADLSVGTVFRLSLGIFGGTLWQPWDLTKCWQNTIGGLAKEEIEKIFFGYSKGSPIISGFPVIIRYDGETHLGRLFVGVIQWA